MNMWRYVIPGWGQVIEPRDLHGREICDNATPQEIRDRLAALIEQSDWYKHQPTTSALRDALTVFKAADDDDSIQDALITIYNLADDEHCWLDPFDMSVN